MYNHINMIIIKINVFMPFIPKLLWTEARTQYDNILGKLDVSLLEYSLPIQSCFSSTETWEIGMDSLSFKIFSVQLFSRDYT